MENKKAINITMTKSIFENVTTRIKGKPWGVLKTKRAQTETPPNSGRDAMLAVIFGS
jgi:hypothetical protein